MFGLGASEILVILVVALVVLGPQRLPELARQLARTLGEMRRVADEVRSHIDDVAQPPEAELPRPLPPGAAAQHQAATAGIDAGAQDDAAAAGAGPQGGVAAGLAAADAGAGANITRPQSCDAGAQDQRAAVPDPPPTDDPRAHR